MPAAVVQFDDVSVRFILHHQRPRSFQDALIGLVHRSNDTSEEFWALRGINFEVSSGEALGIVGQNGSGKSTLLKLMTRILEPTSGKVSVLGKVSALIELGAGFHPDLTGRENIYLNGSILGFGRKQMDRLFGDIVAFSDLERFIDTPVKHYSSGMYLRLGFSVAISVDPDVLIIDEVLSVGDAVFQAKCMDRINEFRRRGKTIIFVSHSLSQVEALCDRVIWLQRGQIRDSGPSYQTVHRYQEEFVDGMTPQTTATRPHVSSSATEPLTVPGRRAGTVTEISDLQLVGPEGAEKAKFVSGDAFRVRFAYSTSESRRPKFGLAISRHDGLLVYRTNVNSTDAWVPDRQVKGVIEARIDSLPLARGRFSVSLVVEELGPELVPVSSSRCRREFEVTNGPPESGLLALNLVWSPMESLIEAASRPESIPV